jgi:hypothetical protein
MARQLVRALAASALLCGTACIDWGDPEMATTSSASAASEEDDCEERCVTKAKGCGATDELADTSCSSLCPADDMELECLEMATCQELGQAFQSGADICGEEEDEACVALGSAGCDPLAGITCCDLATCESATGRCCLPANLPQATCTSNAQCCGNATCQLDPNDGSRRFCQQ